MRHLLCICPIPPPWAGRDRRSIFQRRAIWFEFRFFLRVDRLLNKAEEPQSVLLFSCSRGGWKEQIDSALSHGPQRELQTQSRLEFELASRISIPSTITITISASCRYCCMVALHGRWLDGWRNSLTATTQECCEQWPPTTHHEKYPS